MGNGAKMLKFKKRGTLEKARGDKLQSAAIL